jgi:hypothetical protein
VDVERVLGVDERCDATGRLALRDGVQGQRCLAARFGTEDLDDTALGIASAAEGIVQRWAARWDAGDPLGFPIAEAHHGALSELLFDGLQKCVDGLEWLFHVLLLLVPIDGLLLVTIRVSSGLAIQNSVLQCLGCVSWKDVARLVEGGDRVGDSKRLQVRTRAHLQAFDAEL